MTSIIQLDRNELKELIDEAVRVAINETKHPKPEPTPDQIDKDEVKRMTGQGSSWIYKHTMQGCSDPLPFKKFGKRLVFSRKEIQAYIESHTKQVQRGDDIMNDRLARSAKNKR